MSQILIHVSGLQNFLLSVVHIFLNIFLKSLRFSELSKQNGIISIWEQKSETLFFRSITRLYFPVEKVKFVTLCVV